MALVYAWPPVWAAASEWSVEAPISVSRGWPSGRRYASSAGPSRRVVSLSVLAPGCNRATAGYMAVLARLLDGGLHYVRLRSRQINQTAPLPALSRKAVPVQWMEEAAPLGWSENSNSLLWFTGAVLEATRQGASDLGGFRLSVSGLPPGTIVAWPGEYVTVYRGSDGAESRSMVIAAARSNSSGVAIVRTLSEVAWSGRVDIGTSTTGAFEVLGIPSPQRPHRGNWSYDWRFREVFADEVGGFEERDPWGSHA